MMMNSILRLGLAAVIALAGLIGVGLMLQAELGTGSAAHFNYYFQWALAAGLVFIAVGLALTVVDAEDAVETPFGDDAKP